MLDRIRSFLNTSFGQRSEPASDPDEKSVRIAIAALLVEMSRADFVEEKEEKQVLLELLRGHFFMEQDEAEELLGEAGSRANDAVSLHEFTRAIHTELSEPQKHRFLEMLIQVAVADGHLDKHERHLLSKVADLIYVKRKDFVRIRARVLDAATSG